MEPTVRLMFIHLRFAGERARETTMLKKLRVLPTAPNGLRKTWVAWQIMGGAR